jgi:hypothetical protein
MGAGASDMAVEEEGHSGLGDMPELCAAEVLLRLGAPDICRLAGLNRAFRSAGAADFVWEAKLPENYGYLMGFVDGEEEEKGDQAQRSAMGKKDVYARLAKAVQFDDGKRVSLFLLLFQDPWCALKSNYRYINFLPRCVHVTM